MWFCQDLVIMTLFIISYWTLPLLVKCRCFKMLAYASHMLFIVNNAFLIHYNGLVGSIWRNVSSCIWRLPQTFYYSNTYNSTITLHLKHMFTMPILGLVVLFQSPDSLWNFLRDVSLILYLMLITFQAI